MNATAVVNLRSGRTRRELPQLYGLLEKHGIALDALIEADGTPQLVRTVERARKAGVRRLLVGGGDGSMTQSANVLAHSGMALGVLPLGTGNSFALTLGVGDDLERAVAVIAQDRTADVDLGVVNGRYFVNFATIGFAARVARATDHGLKAKIGALAYVAAALGPLIRKRGFRAKVRAKKMRLDVPTQQAIVLVGRFFGDTPLTPHANDDDGRLRVFLTTGTSRRELLKSYAALAVGLAGKLPEGHLLKGKRFEIRAKPKQRVNVDGDPCGKTPARFSVARHALRVFVPADFGAAH
jgi:YegS/Rv2252/BmrU family lipid kinase